MSIGTIFFIIALVMFFFAAVGVAFIPAPHAWGMVCLTLGFLTSGYAFPGFVRVP